VLHLLSVLAQSLYSQWADLAGDEREQPKTQRRERLDCSQGFANCCSTSRTKLVGAAAWGVC
jgi:hypothetical protein